jgi:hypothetical protein
MGQTSHHLIVKQKFPAYPRQLATNWSQKPVISVFGRIRPFCGSIKPLSVTVLVPFGVGQRALLHVSHPFQVSFPSCTDLSLLSCLYIDRTFCAPDRSLFLTSSSRSSFFSHICETFEYHAHRESRLAASTRCLTTMMTKTTRESIIAPRIFPCTKSDQTTVEIAPYA